MNKFRLLKADEIECRIAQIKEKGLSLLLYKTARTDANLLDEVYGPAFWQNDFKVVDGVLYGGIGVLEETGQWIWKWDAGTESNTEAEKGRASDAFKRAGFKWGIGRELYTAPFIWIPATECSITGNKCYDGFEVTEIGYNEKGEINSLTVKNVKRGTIAFKMGSKPAAPQVTPEEKESFVCAECGAKIHDQPTKNGGFMPVKDYVAACMKTYERVLCPTCRKNRK